MTDGGTIVRNRRSPWIAAIAMAVMNFAASPARADGSDLIQEMDTTAPKYATAECQAARATASKYPMSTLGQVATGAALGLLGPVGLIIAGSMDDDIRNAVKDLFEKCGDEAFVPYFKARAEKGDDDSIAWMGQFNVNHGNGGEAVRWYEIAAAKGNIAAEVNLGAIYAQGQMVPKDMARAEALWRKASEHGSPEGRTNLGNLYMDERRYEDARREFADAVRSGHASAQFFLARLYEEGLGVTKNDKIAYFWYAVAAANGYRDAEAARGRVEALLPEAAVWTIKHRIDSCRNLQFKYCSY